MAGKLSAFFGAQDMTVGNPATNLIRFSTPLLIGNLAQQLYSTVDSIVVGNYVGDSALAAIGASGPIINLLLVLFMGVSVGASIMASQCFGAKDKKRLSHSAGTAITATFAVSIFVMVVGPLITHPIMSALQTPQDIYTMSCDYLIINFLGILGSAYYNIISGILRGLGDSVMPLIFLLVACGMNIGLDIWFVAGFKMGVAGAAWATIISQAVSGILCLVRLLLMRDVLHITWRTLWPTKALLFQLIRLGLPSGLTQAVFSLAMLVVQSLTNKLRYHDHRGFHRCYARGRLCHDAELHLRHGNDDLHRPEHRRRSFGSRGKGHKGRLKARPFRFRGTCCADPVLRPLSHGNVYEYAGRH